MWSSSIFAFLLKFTVRLQIGVDNRLCLSCLFSGTVVRECNRFTHTSHHHPLQGLSFPNCWFPCLFWKGFLNEYKNHSGLMNILAFHILPPPPPPLPLGFPLSLSASIVSPTHWKIKWWLKILIMIICVCALYFVTPLLGIKAVSSMFFED